MHGFSDLTSLIASRPLVLCLVSVRNVNPIVDNNYIYIMNLFLATEILINREGFETAVTSISMWLYMFVENI